MRIRLPSLQAFVVGAAMFLASVFITEAQSSIASHVSAYQQFKDVGATSINVIVPTVVSVPFDREFLERNDFAVLDVSTNLFVPSLFLQSTAPTPLTATSIATGASAFTDGSSATSASFDVPGDRSVQSVIHLRGAVPITTSALTLALENNVALPETIAISAGGRVVVATRPLDSTAVRFPQTRAQDWTVELTHIQPLRINEIHLVEDNVPAGSRSLRFLAQPTHAYRIYFNPDRNVIVPTGEAGDLRDSREIRRIDSQPTQNNASYVPADVDSDGIPDVRDNCVSLANPEQADIDGNGLGDMCQDYDRDGIANVRDNCTDLPNSNQADKDGDGIGDACDTEESRLTEKYAWIPWVGIGFAALVILVLFALTLRAKPPESEV